ncbi:TRAP transporter large permease (plasmid) [Azospirillum oryzae]|uniref:TRAP transporter large permease protein n=1 Tax=Azospirillum oryzae TaxID=286727 RepID=A0A6N1ARI9_9PROT|nr:TRAP transporter large permease [Azospirillum oryzae]KAA0587837.1 TRAP transporter large permease [Azospirillum oryzae]QKS53953.1 TRAP transporter large permease [Azospirillum oryzae]GLR77752.1 C4-dicarboxylate ABC transporter permease [Azospirillum oryzae]
MTVAMIMLALFALLAFGAPVGFAMLISGTVGLLQIGSLEGVLGILETTPLTVAGAYEFITIPLFLLMAEFILLSGMADDLFRATAAWVGRVRGGLGMATALAGAGFGAVCGTSTASAATLSATSLPAMIKQGYEPSLAAGVVSISGTLAMLIPPSVAMVVYGLLANVNIGQLLIAGLLPGILVTLTIMVTVYVLAWHRPEDAPSAEPVTWREKIALLRVVGPMLMLFGAVTGIIYTGIATPTEAAAVGAFGAFLLLWRSGRMTGANVRRALLRAAHGSSMVMVILLGASVFGYFFALTQVTQDLVAWVATLDVSRWVILGMVLLGYIVLGSFMDQIAILVLTVPVVVPLMQSLGFDLVWFGVVKIVTAEIGMITPPIGLNCYVVARYSGRPVSEVFRGTLPHFLAHIVAILILVAFPQIALWLPGQMR